MDKVRYTTIHYAIKNKLNLKLSEYIVADIVYCLSDKTEWCYASKKYIAESLGLSELAIKKIIDKLIEKGILIRKDETNKYLRTTDLWDECFGEPKQSIGEPKQSIGEPKQSIGEPKQSIGEPKQSIGNNNIYNNTNNISTPEGSLESSSKKKFTDEERLKIIEILDLIKKNLNPSLTVGDFKQWGAIKGIKARYGEDYDLIYKTVEYCIRNKNEKYFPRVLNGFDLFDKYQKIIDYSTRPI